MLVRVDESVELAGKDHNPSADFAGLPLGSKALEFLRNVEDPEFDVIELDRLTEGRGLYFIGLHIMRHHGFFDRFKIEERIFRNWLSQIEAGYKRENPYHNSIHAADVTHSINFYITRQKMRDCLVPEEQFGGIIAAIIHDYQHPGQNNNFIMATLNPIAIRYNDQSVLEHFHLASAFELMQSDDCNILATFNADSRKLVRETVISMVLATDMAMHFEWINRFKTKMTGEGIKPESRPDRKILLNMAIKCADVNNPAKPLELCKKWTEKIMTEFFTQGDEERRRGLPVSQFFDRATTDIPKCQVGFITFVVSPLFDAWKLYMDGEIDKIISNVASNKAYWQAKTLAQANVS
ncbi:HD-domain/PDEase-like protein [Gonapodya prolifera JEL478]|uniref:HD-domain/PDEase-like protein n=1 Tax=Gonapodya prolifera (strain JEL478) TaxID=1344416 RepID=A0A139A4Z8_GONPJ|nr:HD-domain/PDEase-like protein [Gonapodya prolifera JEL478]|eukprot:KXS11892.1 HD-domain/PDEase-like protein [Gonapodya prolifera JEL478]